MNINFKLIKFDAFLPLLQLQKQPLQVKAFLNTALSHIQNLQGIS